MRIGGRISFGFALMVALAGLMGLVGWFSLNSVASAAASARRAQDLVILIDGIRSDALSYRRDPTDELAADLAKRLDEARAAVDRVVAESRWEGGEGETARAALDSFAASFTALVEASRRNAVSLEGMDRRSAEITELAEDFDVSELDEAREHVFAIRLALASMRGVEQGLRAGRIADATSDMMSALRSIFTATMRLKPVVSGRLADGVAQIGETILQYRTEFESVRAVADRRRDAGEGIVQAAASLDQLLRAAAEAETSAMERVVRTAAWLLPAGVSAGIAAGVLLALLLTKGIVRPIRALTEAMEGLAGGDLAVAVAGTGRSDEIGAMARAVGVFKENAEEVRRLQADKAEQERRARRERREVREHLAERMRETLGSLVESVSDAAGRLEHSAQSLSANASQTARQAESVTEAAHHTLAGLEAVLAAAEDLSRSAAEIGRRTEESSGIAREAAEEMLRTDDTMKALARSAEGINNVLELIRAVAAQTNLLSLNATVEAARAGESGKGFAVVAGEVKALAGKTAAATGEIGAQIAAMQGEAGQAMSAIDRTGTIVSRMEHLAGRVTVTVEGQAAATRDIVDTLTRAAADTRLVSGNIAGVTRAAGAAGGEADSVLDAARGLSRDAQSLRREVEAFIADILRE